MNCSPSQEPAATTTYRDELFRSVESMTAGQVRDLHVACTDDGVRVTGRSTTWYAKQLVTRAIFKVAPHVRLENRVLVAATS